jgi:EAL domain-containing protein (putative c-di-GMP-specific phosphodiesterase class I)
MGCHIAIDDFGVGFQSFERLKQIPVDVIKIDGSFVRDMLRSERDRELVRASVEVARAFAAQTVAEYVGDAATAQLLRDLGVDWGQGYWFGHPMPIADAMGLAGHVGPDRAALAVPA